MKCSHCHTENDEVSKYCTKCGNPLKITPDPLVCPNCQQKNKPGSIHCSECGNALIEKPEELVAEKKKSRKKTRITPLMRVLVVVLVLVAIAILAYALGLIKITGLPSAGTSSQLSADPTTIKWNCDSLKNATPPVVSLNSPINISFGWVASTREQVQDFFDHARFTISVDGSPADARPYPGEILPSGDLFIGNYVVEIDPLEAGVHFINTRVILDEKVYDGVEEYGPGTDNNLFENICTIMVE